MRDLLLAFAFLLMGFVALQKRATREPYDYRTDLLSDAKSEDSLASALEKALKKKQRSVSRDQHSQK